MLMQKVLLSKVLGKRMDIKSFLDKIDKIEMKAKFERQ